MTKQVEKQAAFRRGFLRELAAHGLTPTEFVDKAAGVKEIAESLVGAARGVPSLLGDAGKLTAGLVVGVPLAAGATMGYLAGGNGGVTKQDVEAMREQDLIDSYERATGKLLRRRTLRPQVVSHA